MTVYHLGSDDVVVTVVPRLYYAESRSGSVEVEEISAFFLYNLTVTLTDSFFSILSISHNLSNLSLIHMQQQQKLTREEFKKQKDLEEARKSGLAPAEVDEEGKDINPHIPQYMSKAPWYLDTGGPSLRHQRQAILDKKEENKSEWYQRGMRAGPAATKYRKGACENCGAMSHKVREYLM